MLGNVYNITPYLDFHPGGVAELMRGAGIDCSELFDEVCFIIHLFIHFSIHSFIHSFIHLSLGVSAELPQKLLRNKWDISVCTQPPVLTQPSIHLG